MAEWLQQVSQWHEMYFHVLEVISSNPGQVELGMHSTSVLSRTQTKHMYKNSKWQQLLHEKSNGDP